MRKMGPLAIGALVVYLVGAQLFISKFKLDLPYQLVVWFGLIIFVALVMAVEDRMKK